jgi:hypothetical protein
MIAAPVAQAASTADQVVPASGSNTALHSNLSAAQSFTAGQTGDLTSISITLNGIYSTSAITVDVYNVNGSGFPTGAPLATTTLPASAFTGTWQYNSTVNVPFNPAPRVVAGTTYAFAINALQNDGITTFSSAFYAAQPYSGGGFFACDPTPTCVWQSFAFDLGFTTYIDTGSPADLTLWQKAYARSSAAEVCQSGWNPSWMEWPNDHKGGYVCVRNTYAYYPDAPYVE